MPTISKKQAQRILAHWPEILAELASGRPIHSFVRSLGFSPSSIYALRMLYPERDAEWLKAHEESADALFDRFLEVLDEKPKDQTAAADKRTRLDMILRAAAKRNPRQYSDKSQLDVNVKTVDLTRIIEAANARLSAQHPSIAIAAPNSGALPSVVARAQALPVLDVELVPERTLADLQ